MKRILTPLYATTVIAMLTAFSTNVRAQSPLGSQITEPSAKINYVDSPSKRPYTVPIDPRADHVAPSAELTQRNALPVQFPWLGSNAQAESHLEPVNVETVNASPTSVIPAVAETELETAGTDHVSVKPEASFPFDLATGGVTEKESFGAETIFSEIDADCNCSGSISYRSECSQCRNRSCLFPNRGQHFIGGWLQQGFTSNLGSPSDRRNEPVLFNDRSNDYRLNQLYFFAEKDIRANRGEWDLGGRVDVLLGSDSRFLTVAGLERHKDRTRKWNSETDDYGIAVPQAYVEVGVPWFDGFSIKAGHFYANTGYESVPSPDNFFYSHSYSFIYGEPFTFTGALSEARVNDRLTLRAGYTNGWDVFDSSSDEFGVLAGFTFSSADKRSSLTATMNSGNDVTNSRVGGKLLDADRHFLSVVLQHEVIKCWRYVIQSNFGYQEDAEIIVNPATSTISNDTAKWYGISNYVIHDINPQLSSALRVEWFRDQDHSRIGIPVSFVPGGPTLKGGNYVSLTGGYNWRPHQNVAIRPELRWDYSDVKGNAAAPGGDPSFRTFDDNTSSSQGTAALDVILLF